MFSISLTSLLVSNSDDITSNDSLIVNSEFQKMRMEALLA